MAAEQPDDVRAHIELIAARTRSESEQLAEALSGRAWPGGADDRTEPGALDWLRLWRPRGPVPAPPLCGCAEGHCLLCN
jgi:hypothetical protein